MIYTSDVRGFTSVKNWHNEDPFSLNLPLPFLSCLTLYGRVGARQLVALQLVALHQWGVSPHLYVVQSGQCGLGNPAQRQLRLCKVNIIKGKLLLY